MENIKDKAYRILNELYGDGSDFRAGQYEAIEATLSNNRTLVVQKTGWGKSLVYFTCTKLLREQGRGVTLVVSPLLVLMDNQLEAANRLNLKCDMLNSATKDRRKDIIDNIKNDNLDLVLVTPETMFSTDVQAALKDIRIGLFVIDEVHCISDWGHDFRLEYGNINKVIRVLPTSVPILATTATANNRVVDDIKKQLGDNVYLSRGALTRESLIIQVTKMKDKASRYAWILKNLNDLPGTGIIYCLTQRDCDYLTEFLRMNGISALSYYSRDKNDENLNRIALEKFSNNEIKVIVATIKLGMGYDKGDIGYVIHLQKPANIVTYYQQIGRAGRNISKAYAILLAGEEDDRITDYFIDTAFPEKAECESIYHEIDQDGGIKLGKIVSKVNIKRSRIDKALNFLMNEGAIMNDKGGYFTTAKKYIYNQEHYEDIKKIRRKEKEQMNELTTTTACYSKFVVNCLDDMSADDCGRCANCREIEIIGSNITLSEIDNALAYLNNLSISIEPRKLWAVTAITPKQSKIAYQNEVGICLCRCGDPGYGELVKRGKYIDKRFSDELVGKSSSTLRDCVRHNNITHIVCVPSLRNDIVEHFARRLAESLKLEFALLLTKSTASPQKDMENSSYQCYNAQKSFEVVEGEYLPDNVILVDDTIDSRWTLTVCGYKLMEMGVKRVFPFALADDSQRERE